MSFKDEIRQRDREQPHADLNLADPKVLKALRVLIQDVAADLGCRSCELLRQKFGGSTLRRCPAS